MDASRTKCERDLNGNVNAIWTQCERNGYIIYDRQLCFSIRSDVIHLHPLFKSDCLEIRLILTIRSFQISSGVPSISSRNSVVFQGLHGITEVSSMHWWSRLALVRCQFLTTSRFQDSVIRYLFRMHHTHTFNILIYIYVCIHTHLFIYIYVCVCTHIDALYTYMILYDHILYDHIIIYDHIWSSYKWPFRSGKRFSHIWWNRIHSDSLEHFLGHPWGNPSIPRLNSQYVWNLSIKRYKYRFAQKRWGTHLKSVFFLLFNSGVLIFR